MQMEPFEQSVDPWLGALLQITRQMGPQRPFQASITMLLRTLSSRLGFLRPHLVLFDPETGQLRLSVADARPRENHANYTPGVGVTGHVFATGRPVIVEKLKGDPLFLSLLFERSEQEMDELSFISVPVLAPSEEEDMAVREVIGTLNADTRCASSEELKRRCLFLENAAALIANYSAFLRKGAHRLSPSRTAAPAEDEPFFLTRSKVMTEVLEQARHLASGFSPVLISGESGTGKETLAAWMHRASPRSGGPFRICRCPLLPRESMLAELCGFQKGAFLGAMHTQKGLFEEAATGTVFLQSVDAMPLDAQAELLRLIKEQKILRAGATDPVPVNVRIIASTSASLEKLAQSGAFLPELCARLCANEIHLPPLRERVSDIASMAEQILARLAPEGGPAIKLSNGALERLSQYYWPGNIAELSGCLAHAAQNSKGGTVQVADLPPSLQTAEGGATAEGLSLGDAVADFETKLLRDALQKADGNMLKTAKLLKTSYRIVNYKIKKYGIDPRTYAQRGK